MLVKAIWCELFEKLGVTDTIPSPTYTLCETYTINRTQVISHMDLYRLQDPEELEFLGFREMLDGHGVLIEWPERAASFLPSPDLDLHLMWDGDRRICALAAKSEKENIGYPIWRYQTQHDARLSNCYFSRWRLGTRNRT